MPTISNGLFVFLPIRTAGCYCKDHPVERASDYFISSYTPTVGTLLRNPPITSTRVDKMMVVIQSQELPSTETELRNIHRHVPDDTLEV
jgi:hypothetical protein